MNIHVRVMPFSCRSNGKTKILCVNPKMLEIFRNDKNPNLKSSVDVRYKYPLIEQNFQFRNTSTYWPSTIVRYNLKICVWSSRIFKKNNFVWTVFRRVLLVLSDDQWILMELYIVSGTTRRVVLGVIKVIKFAESFVDGWYDVYNTLENGYGVAASSPLDLTHYVLCVCVQILL